MRTGERLAGTAEFTVADLLAATGGELVQAGSTMRCTGVTTDSRGLRAGEVFIAVRGDRHDGHDFVGEAASRGAGAVLVEPERATAVAECTTVCVRDGLAALGDLARWHRQRNRAPVLAVAGSNGKTTTKEMVSAIAAAALGGERVLRTRGSENNLVGLPLTLLRLERGHAMVVLELGMNVPGEVWRLAAIAMPDVGVVTCVQPEHLEGVGSVRGAAEAEGELYRRLRASATAVVNTEEPLLGPSLAAFSGRRVTFGPGGDVRATGIEDLGVGGTRFHLEVGAQTCTVRLRVAGRHNVTNALAAAATAHAAGIDVEAIRQGLEAVRAPRMRMEVRRLASGVTLVDDCYNANPGSMAAALQTVRATPATRRVAVLGEMRELGAHTEVAHRELGRAAAAADLALLVLVGETGDVVAAGARAAGMPAERIVCAQDRAEVGARLATMLGAGDLLLVKGSRGARLEAVVEFLEAAD